ncbi:MAG: 50S ribosomal protein L4 [Candidatus Latescibacterota bacterium]|nr:MAG: 50S ribosomal protein L4 [Candidatus Latescibacterota bacterium]
MAEAMLQTFEGQEKGTVTLPDSAFGVEPKEQAVYEAVKGLLANQRHGTNSTKTRHEVSGSGSKPWRQKGTGRARSGTSTSPLWVGGGRIHGPRPRDYDMRIPKKIRRVALLSVLSDKAKEGRIVVIDALPRLEAPKSKTFAEFWKRVAKDGEKCLLVVDSFDENVFKSVRNLPRLAVTTVGNLNAYEAIRVGRIVLTADALRAFEKTE